MRHLNEKDHEIFLILKILLKDSSQKGFLIGDNQEKIKEHLKKILSDLDYEKKVIFIKGSEKNVYSHILKGLGSELENVNLEDFLIEFHRILDNLEKRLIIVVEDTHSMEENEIINFLRVVGGEKNVSVIFIGNSELNDKIERLKTKKIFTQINFVFQIENGKNLFPVVSAVIVLMASGLSLLFILNSSPDIDKNSEVKKEIIEKDREIISKIQEEVVIEKQVKKQDYNDLCGLSCQIEKELFSKVSNITIPETNYKKEFLKEKYRIYAGAFKNIENAEKFSEKIRKMTGFNPEIESVEKVNNVYIKAFSKEEAFEIRKRLYEIGIKPYIKRVSR
ncbi:SPOR domain-containing protein [Persephonella sp.]